MLLVNVFNNVFEDCIEKSFVCSSLSDAFKRLTKELKVSCKDQLRAYKILDVESNIVLFSQALNHRSLMFNIKYARASIYRTKLNYLVNNQRLNDKHNRFDYVATYNRLNSYIDNIYDSRHAMIA
jgi:hypothetical protein